jgi:hypothetical protein
MKPGPTCQCRFCLISTDILLCNLSTRDRRQKNKKNRRLECVTGSHFNFSSTNSVHLFYPRFYQKLASNEVSFC